MNVEFHADGRSATIIAEPAHHRPVAFTVTVRRVPNRSSWYGAKLNEKFVVGLHGSNGDGFSTHNGFEQACRSAMCRARRFEKAYAKPRGLQVAR